MDVVWKLFALHCFVFLGAASIPYAQAAILNLPHPYLRRTVVFIDTGCLAHAHYFSTYRKTLIFRVLYIS